MSIQNQLEPRHRDWSEVTFSGLPTRSGVLFEEMTLDPQIGPEAVALLIDSEQEQLLLAGSLNLNLRPGIAATTYGPVLFLIWWIPPIVNGRPTAFYEQVMNPLHPETAVILRRLAEQTHLHLIVIDGSGRVRNFFEYKNTFGFDRILAGVDGSRVAWPGPNDFRLAKDAYYREYEIDEIFAAE